jgi:TonB-linked SusC/RagA family outer membrane protein
MSSSSRSVIRSLLVAALLPGAAAALAVAPARAGAQQPAAATGVVAGRVTERGTTTPVPAAQVFVQGTTRGAVTGEDGSYRITGVPAGAVTLRVRRLGYEAAVQQVAVAAGATAAADFAIGRTAAQTLEQVVVTATGEQQRVREQGTAPARVTLPVERVPALPAFSQALAGQAPGVQVLQSSGTAGTGSRIRVRGANSLSLSNEPLIIIDGVRVTGAGTTNAIASSIGVGGQQPSRLDDINPEEIESIEVLRGPAASGLYGTQAANGVVQITTKRGRAGRTQWTAYGEAGATRDVSPFPANYGAYGTFEGEREFGCDLLTASLGGCTQTEVVSFNPLKDARTTPFRTGERTQLGANVAGGTERANYFLSAEQDRESGIYRTNAANRNNLRANLAAALSPQLDVNVSAGYVDNRVQLPGNDNTFLGYISNGLAGFARPDDPGSVNQDGYDPLGPESIDAFQNFQRTRRFIGSTQANYRPFPWLRFTGVAGLDLINRLDTQQIPPQRILLDAETTEGYRAANRYQLTTFTGQLTSTANFSLTRDLASTTTLSFQYQQDATQGVEAFGRRLVAGTSSLEGAQARFDIGENYGDNRLAGGIVTQQFGYRDKLFVTGGVRGDNSSAFGRNFGTVYYPTAQLSWVASEEPWLPRGPLGLVRLRGAFGQSGLRPGNLDALTYLNPVAARVQGQEAAAVTVGGVGDPDLRPEITTEVEAGVDLEAFAGRVTVGASYYNRQSRDALVQRVLPPSAGLVRTRFENIGKIRNAGVEALLTVQAVRTRPAELALTFNYSRNSNRIVSLRDTAPILVTTSGSQRHAQGYPAGGYWGRPVESVEYDAAGQVTDVTLASEARFLGYSQPRTLLGVTPVLSLFNNVVRLSALVDYRGGYKQFNASEEFRCAVGRCRGIVDPNAPQDERVRAASAQLSAAGFAPFIEDASFVRLREASVTLALPQALARRYAAARAVSLTLAGYNLGIATDYTGVDPEVNASAQSNFIQSDFLSQAPVRRFAARLNVSF